MKHLLVTNDFPPKLGGIQSYLWELWRRLPADEATVLTTPHAGAEAFDRAAETAAIIERCKERVAGRPSPRERALIRKRRQAAAARRQRAARRRRQTEMMARRYARGRLPNATRGDIRAFVKVVMEGKVRLPSSEQRSHE